MVVVVVVVVVVVDVVGSVCSSFRLYDSVLLIIRIRIILAVILAVIIVVIIVPITGNGECDWTIIAKQYTQIRSEYKGTREKKRTKKSFHFNKLCFFRGKNKCLKNVCTNLSCC